MKTLLLASCALLLSSCAALRPTPEQKLATLVERYPQLVVADTVRDTVVVEIPSIEFRKVFVPVSDTARLQADRASIDSLLARVEATLDSAQYVATRDGIYQWAQERPVLYDTLCFDTLGVQGRVWRDGQAYRLWVQRKQMTASKPVEIVVTKLTPCPPAPFYPLYDPRGWAWWLLVAVGFAGGVSLSYGLFRAALTTAR
ncbi:hypothetical protein [Hymenobacter swuensis]|uniref:Uncharacterized protein n=1 Tax=Hymenobacter swuensis DY53 TaxID=1227739 RepID=W8F4L4_9BACT|nr:hypothetical protein [Hymenobacter swuensis]AHJ98937.1 hypothetical protein Hsw_3342 [Hymenobacter swuensis DY53]